VPRYPPDSEHIIVFDDATYVGHVVVGRSSFRRLDCFMFILISEQLFHVPWSIVMCWGLISSYYFYGTGHQTAISSINWYAAFVGTGGQFNNHVIPAILIGRFLIPSNDWLLHN